MNYQKNVAALKGKSFDELCTFCTLDWNDLTRDDREKLTREGYADDDGVETVTIPLEVWFDLEKTYDGDQEWDDDEFDYLTEAIIRPAAGYLVFNSCTDWMGHSGYLVADTFKDALSRSYDVTQSIEKVSKGGKALLVRESSHDVPMGADEVIVAMTEREKRMAENGDISFAKPYITALAG